MDVLIFLILLFKRKTYDKKQSKCYIEIKFKYEIKVFSM